VTSSNEIFRIHRGGKLDVTVKTPIRNRDDLAAVYTPGVAQICLAIADDPSRARELTIKSNTVAVVTDGTAVLGLGDIGPLAALPVMEGKAALFKRFANIDAFPICLDTTDVDQIVDTVIRIAPVFAGINLEDISAPRCFEIERRLRDALNIPVFHDDQHGTAIVTLAALWNALKVVDKSLSEVSIVLCGAGAAGQAILRALLRSGATNVVMTNRGGVIHAGRTDLDQSLDWVVEQTNPAGRTGTVQDVIVGADVFIGVSGPDLLSGADIRAMAPDAIVFAMANPEPEVDPALAAEHARVVATGRSDYPNQINNVLVFPGLFRGLLDAHAERVSTEMMMAAARALAEVVPANELSPTNIIPSVFEPAATEQVAAAVAAVARAEHAAAGSGLGPADFEQATAD
jgi:malate dehydrogenase (oxaloacetate-decarboxylating)